MDEELVADASQVPRYRGVGRGGRQRGRQHVAGKLAPLLAHAARPIPRPPSRCGKGGHPASATLAPPFLRRERGAPESAPPAPPFPVREGGLGGLGRAARQTS